MSSPSVEARTGPATGFAPPPQAELRTLLEEAARLDGPVTVALPAPSVPPERLLRTASRGPAILWDPPEGDGWAGLGAFRFMAQEGPRALERVRREAGTVPEACLAVSGARPLEGLRWFGGAAFAPGRGVDPIWAELGEGFFLLPRVLYLREGDGARLVLCADGPELRDPELRSRWAVRLLDLVAGLERGEPHRRSARPVGVDTLALEPWSDRVEAIRAVIADGRFEKIVAARRSGVTFAEAVDPVAVLSRLADGLRWSTRFLFRRDRASFLGATPERLVRRTGSRIETEALAGSIGLGEEQARRLLASDKDLEEHRFVVEEIVRRLRSLDIEPEVAAGPRIRELREVLHLHTPIRARSIRAPHVLELVAALHPTPAVGGVPTDESIDWIVEREEAGRGWYSGPIGWFDAAGDGEFAVALRSCLVDGARAWLYAGAGIVADSDPEKEYAETELKQMSLLRALGA